MPLHSLKTSALISLSLIVMLSCKRGSSGDKGQSAGSGSAIQTEDNSGTIDADKTEDNNDNTPAPEEPAASNEQPFIPDRLVKHDRPCDSQPAGACIFQARSFLTLNEKFYEVIIAKDTFYILQIIKGYNGKKVYYKDYEMGYGKKITEMFKHDLTGDASKKCIDCSIDSLEILYTNKEPILSITRGNFYENYKFKSDDNSWHEWIPGNTLTSVGGRYVKGTSNLDASKFPCSSENPDSCKFDTRTLSQKSYGQLESITSQNRYYNFVKKPDNSFEVWDSNGSLLGDVPRYKLGPCKDLPGDDCKFETRTFQLENNIDYESITANGKYFVFFNDASGKAQMWQGNLDDVARYKTKTNGLNAVTKHGLSGGDCHDNALMDAQWGYNWGVAQNINSEHCKDQEFVGMIWGPRAATKSKVGANGASNDTNNTWSISSGEHGQVTAEVKLKYPKIYSSELIFKGFDFQYIPSDSQILGIKVSIKRHNATIAKGQIRDVEAVLVKADGQRSNSKALAQDWPSPTIPGPQQWHTYGAINDKWNFNNITMEDLKNKDFSFSLKVNTTQNTNEVAAVIENVEMRVFYVPSLAYTKANSRSEYLLGFNEPNSGSQGNLSPDEAAFMWNEIEKIYANEYKLIAPAPSQKEIVVRDTQVYDPENDGGLKWLKDFHAAYQKKYNKAPKMHALAAHCYDWEPGSNANTFDTTYCKSLFREYIKQSKEWNLPQGLWVTEFGLFYLLNGNYNDYINMLGAQSVTNIKEGIKDIVSWLITNPDIYRYAWFTHRQGADCFTESPNPNCPRTPAFIYDTKDPTYIGEIYRSFGEE